MRIDVLTLFPEMFSPVLGASMLGRAAQKGILEFSVHNIRDYSTSKHKNTDDYPFGGGAGMVMMPQPIFSCLDTIDENAEAYRVVLTPRGETLNVALAQELAQKERLLFLCGHYEGIDERVMGKMHREVSIGDYVLTGGELAAMVVIDCISRFIPGVLGSDESAMDESFSDGLLEYPQYTRPSEFCGEKVPEVLLNGNHAAIARWRREQSLLITLKNRPELLEGVSLTKADRLFLEAVKNGENQGK
ncbi:MAG TPA: tRNA (guanosine(37)-N1)-methyltransferase TrmD [Clostridia bacterium]|nr:tRNA (guanosine(37)-N1)-methyltransferase TrmD [Clostridia bacterium]